jgi:putative transposase
MALHTVEVRGISIRRSCALYSVSVTCYRYSAKNSDENDLLAKALMTLSQQHRTFGFGLMYLHLRNVQGKVLNHKHVYDNF